MKLPVDPKRTGVKAVLIEEFVFDAEPGQCQWKPDEPKLYFACPGCGAWGGVRIGHPKPEKSPSWDIVSGMPEDPSALTLAPSINCIGCCGWHGYLKNGVFESC